MSASTTHPMISKVLECLPHLVGGIDSALQGEIGEQVPFVIVAFAAGTAIHATNVKPASAAMEGLGQIVDNYRAAKEAGEPVKMHMDEDGKLLPVDGGATLDPGAPSNAEPFKDPGVASLIDTIAAICNDARNFAKRPVGNIELAQRIVLGLAAWNPGEDDLRLTLDDNGQPKLALVPNEGGKTTACSSPDHGINGTN